MTIPDSSVEFVEVLPKTRDRVSRLPGFRLDDGTGIDVVRRKPGGDEQVPFIRLWMISAAVDELCSVRKVDESGNERSDMLDSLRSILRAAWPFAGAAYLLYLALQQPPVRYVGLGGLLVVTPLLVGWIIGRLFGIGPWARPEDRSSGHEDG